MRGCQDFFGVISHTPKKATVFLSPRKTSLLIICGLWWSFGAATACRTIEIYLLPLHTNFVKNGPPANDLFSCFQFQARSHPIFLRHNHLIDSFLGCNVGCMGNYFRATYFGVRREESNKLVIGPDYQFVRKRKAIKLLKGTGEINQVYDRL